MTSFIFLLIIKNNSSLGFAFINFIDPMHIVLFYEFFNGKNWKRFHSTKVCELVYSKLQGKKNLILHFEKGSIMSHTDDKKPLILQQANSPPQIELPKKCLEVFLKLYPYSLYRTYQNSFIVESFYNF